MSCIAQFVKDTDKLLYAICYMLYYSIQHIALKVSLMDFLISFICDIQHGQMKEEKIVLFKQLNCGYHGCQSESLGKSKCYKNKTKKRSRTRVTIGRQCVLLQNFLKIKIQIFLRLKLLYESHLFRHTSKPLKKIVKILETRLQSSKNAPKLTTKNCKIHGVDKSTLVFGFQQLFCVPF